MGDKLRGHDIYNDGTCWRYLDNNDETVANWQSRNCGHCHMENRSDGHDACLGELPNVMNACCGHGVLSEAYVQFHDGSIAKGEEAIRIFNRLMKEREP